MKVNFLLLTFITAAVSSCSTAYKTGQTPDDVYYSPARLQTDDVRRDREENTTTDNTVYTNTEDREIRRRVHNRRYRRYDDRYDYPYGYNGYGYPVYGNPKTATTQNPPAPRKTNLGAYTPNTTTPTSTNPKMDKVTNTGTSTTPVRTFGSPGTSTKTGSAVGNLIRSIFNGDGTSNSNSNNNNNNNSNSSSPSRSFDRGNSNTSNNSNNSSNSSSSSSSKPSSSTSAPVRTFKNN